MACPAALCSRGSSFGSTSAHDQRGKGTFWNRNRKKRKRYKRTESSKEKREGGKPARGSQRMAAATGGNHWALVCVF